MVSNTRLFTIVMALATFVVVIDNTIMNVSINALVKDLHTTITGIQAAISLNALTMAAFVLMGGKLADILGIKTTFTRGSYFYIAGSLLASVSNNLWVFILGWCVIQGIGAALMLPNVQTAIRAYLSGDARARSYGIIGGVNSLGVAIGPILGGFLTTYYSWRWAFRIEVITLIVMLFMSGVIPKDEKLQNPPKLDRLGVALQACTMIFLILGVLLIGDYGLFVAKQPLYIGTLNLAFFGLSPAFYSFILGLAFLRFFTNHENSREKQNQTTLLSLSLFKNTIFAKSLNVASIQTLMIAGVLFTIPLFLQVTFGLTPFETGFYLLPLSLGLLAFALIGVRLKKRYTARTIIVIGWSTVIFSTLVLLLQMGQNAGPNDLIPGLIIFGAGMGLLASQTANVVMSSVKREESAEASGVLNTFQQFGNSAGVAILGTILSVVLLRSLTNQVAASTVITPENKDAISTQLTQGVEIASNQYIQEVSSQKTTDQQAQEITNIYSFSRTKAFQATTITLGILAIIALIITIRVPKNLKVREVSELDE